VKLTSTQDRELNYLRALVYGDTGIGKTTSLGTLPNDRTTICIGERGAIPLRGMAYQVFQFDEWDDLRTILLYFRKPDEIKDEHIKKVVAATKILAFDGLSEISDICIRQIVTVDRKKLVRERTKERTDKPENIYEEQMAMEDWGLYRTRMLNLISAFCHLPLHIIFTCLAGWSKDKQGGDTIRSPNLSGKAARECGAYFDLLLHMESTEGGDGNDARVWRTANNSFVLAKDASGLLDELEPADWMKLFTKILGKKKEQTK
jgi:hypothetical protein